MKKIIALFGLLLAANSQAAVLSLSTDQTSYQVGDTVTLNIIGSDFAEVSAFDFDLLFDTTALTGGSLTGTDLNTGMNWFLNENFSASGLTLAFTAFDDFFAPEAVGTGNALLASVSFVAQTAGQFSLMFDSLTASFSDANFTPLNVDFNGLTVNVTDANAVPEPGSLALAALALFGLMGARRRA
ncbi:hypothetical protein GCM10009092_14210 [Bowmanella denitrificans]|uniref:Ice-binding protein C-terminal domain-containing protein n=1 Tax=Bowmanella denitrificans TaxID=366582 RepID=A0ABP3GSN6_9ALTE